MIFINSVGAAILIIFSVRLCVQTGDATRHLRKVSPKSWVLFLKAALKKIKTSKPIWKSEESIDGREFGSHDDKMNAIVFTCWPLPIPAQRGIIEAQDLPKDGGSRESTQKDLTVYFFLLPKEFFFFRPTVYGSPVR